MQGFATQHPGMFVGSILVWVAIVWAGIGTLISLTSGWRSLAETYTTDREFPGHQRKLQSARMRAGANYNNILTLGSDSEGLFLKLTLKMFLSHPPLLIPWTEVVVEEPTRYLFVMMRTFRLGPNGIPLRVREPLAQFLLESRPASAVQRQDEVKRWGF